MRIELCNWSLWFSPEAQVCPSINVIDFNWNRNWENFCSKLQVYKTDLLDRQIVWLWIFQKATGKFMSWNLPVLGQKQADGDVILYPALIKIENGLRIDVFIFSAICQIVIVVLVLKPSFHIGLLLSQCWQKHVKGVLFCFKIRIGGMRH
jgi:hypothetical protein